MKQKRFIIAIAALVLGIILFLVLSVILFKNIMADSDKLLSLRKDIKTFETLEMRMADYEKFLTENAAAKSRIEDMFPDMQTPISFISFLEKLAGELALDIKITPGAAGKDGSWPTLEFTIAAKGGYEGVFIFLKKLENAPYLIEIRNVNLARDKEGLINFTFQVKVYVK